MRDSTPVEEKWFIFAYRANPSMPAKPTWWLKKRELADSYVHNGADLVRSKVADSYKKRIRSCGKNVSISLGTGTLSLIRIDESVARELMEVENIINGKQKIRERVWQEIRTMDLFKQHEQLGEDQEILKTKMIELAKKRVQ